MPTIALYLPFIAKTLGGADGWETPFIVQNADTVPTELELSFYSIDTGALAARHTVRALAPSTSFAERPNLDPDLRDNAAYSLVVLSFGAKVVAVVNEQRGAGSRFVADAYVSQIGGAPRLFVPSVVRRVGGFSTRIVIQNVDDGIADLTAIFRSLDGQRSAVVVRTIEPGRSSIIDVDTQSELVDGTEYAVSVTASARIIAIANTERASDRAPMLYSYGALIDGANVVYGPYARKNGSGDAATSRIGIQNMGLDVAAPTLTLTPLGGGVATTWQGTSLAPGAVWSVDLGYPNGDRAQAPCATAAPPRCLADGEYSWSAGAAGAQLAAIVTIVGTTTAMAYGAMSRPSDAFLPNVTRRLGGRDGWTTPIIVQSVSATRIRASWYRFSDGMKVATQEIPIAVGSALRIDPRDVSGLVDNAQYSVLLEGGGGRLLAIVIELNFQGGDGGAIYPGFFR